MNGGQRPFLPITSLSPTMLNGRFSSPSHLLQPRLTAVSDDGRRMTDDGMNGGRRPFLPHHLTFSNRD
ncbi:MAG: hypothetical protein H6668_12005 [Ardenticatenaceae bacterium]|nr:hypothetical protein [Ardenticatenaceae bacterium]